MNENWTLETLEQQRVMLVRIAGSILGPDCPAVNSIVDEAIEEVRTQVATDQIPTSLRTLTCRTLVRRVLDWSQTNQPSKQISEPASVTLDEERNRGVELIQRCLEKLRFEDRALLVLIYIEDYDRKEVAEMLSIKLGALNARFYRARERFRKAYEELAQ